MLLKILDNTLPFLRLKSAVVLVDLLLTLLLFFQEFLDAIQPLFFKLLNLGVSLSVVGLSFPVSLSLGDALSFLCICEALLRLLLLLLLALLEDLHVRLDLHLSCGEDFIESGPLLLLFYFTAKLIADFHRSRVSKSRRHLTGLRVLLQNEFIDRLLRQEVEADHHLARILGCSGAANHGKCQAWRMRRRVGHRR